jgi:hypothetical protein
MTRNQFKVFNRIVSNRRNNKSTIDFKNKILKNVDFSKFEFFRSIKIKTNHEDFHKEVMKNDFLSTCAVFKAKDYYLENVACMKYELFDSFYRNYPEEFENFYNWIIDELLPQYKIYINDKKSVQNLQ